METTSIIEIAKLILGSGGIIALCVVFVRTGKVLKTVEVLEENQREFRREMKGMRDEFRAEMKEMRSDLSREMKEINERLSSEIRAVSLKIDYVSSPLNERVIRLEERAKWQDVYMFDMPDAEIASK